MNIVEVVEEFQQFKKKLELAEAMEKDGVFDKMRSHMQSLKPEDAHSPDEHCRKEIKMPKIMAECLSPITIGTLLMIGYIEVLKAKRFFDKTVERATGGEQDVKDEDKEKDLPIVQATFEVMGEGEGDVE